MSNAIESLFAQQEKFEDVAADTRAQAPAPAPSAPAATAKSARPTKAVETSLKDQTIAHLSDPTLVKYLADMPADDQTWVFYALIADAANQREGAAIHHLRDLIKSGAIEGFVQKHLEKDFSELRGAIDLNLKKIERSIADLQAVEEEKSIEALAQEVARKVKVDVARGMSSLADDLDQRVGRLVKLQKEASEENQQMIGKINALQKDSGIDAERLSHKVGDAVSEKVGQKLGNNNLLMLGASSLFALAFGVLAGISLSTGYTKTEIQQLVQMTAEQTAEQMRAAPAPTQRR